MKRIIAIGMIIAMMLLMTACGGESYGPITPIEDIEVPDFSTDDLDVGIKEEEPTSEAGSDYSKIFTDRYIVHMPSVFLGLDSVSYAVDAGDYVEAYDFGCDGDVIVEWVITEYYSNEKYPMENIRANFAKFEGHSFCEVEYEELNSYNVVKVHMTNLDSSENYSVLYDMGLTTELGKLSVEKTGEGLVQQGYVKK